MSIPHPERRRIGGTFTSTFQQTHCQVIRQVDVHALNVYLAIRVRYAAGRYAGAASTAKSTDVAKNRPF